MAAWPKHVVLTCEEEFIQYKGMRHITTLRSTMDRIYDDGNNII